jgi:hypothetical protein
MLKDSMCDLAEFSSWSHAFDCWARCFYQVVLSSMLEDELDVVRS